MNVTDINDPSPFTWKSETQALAVSFSIPLNRLWNKTKRCIWSGKSLVMKELVCQNPWSEPVVSVWRSIRIISTVLGTEKCIALMAHRKCGMANFRWTKGSLEWGGGVSFHVKPLSNYDALFQPGLKTVTHSLRWGNFNSSQTVILDLCSQGSDIKWRLSRNMNKFWLFWLSRLCSQVN